MRKTTYAKLATEEAIGGRGFAALISMEGGSWCSRRFRERFRACTAALLVIYHGHGLTSYGLTQHGTIRPCPIPDKDCQDGAPEGPALHPLPVRYKREAEKQCLKDHLRYPGNVSLTA